MSSSSDPPPSPQGQSLSVYVMLIFGRMVWGYDLLGRFNLPGARRASRTPPDAAGAPLSTADTPFGVVCELYEDFDYVEAGHQRGRVRVYYVAVDEDTAGRLPASETGAAHECRPTWKPFGEVGEHLGADLLGVVTACGIRAGVL